MVWYSYLFKNFPQFVVIHTVKDFSIVNEAEIEGFLFFIYLFFSPRNSDFLHDPENVVNLISGSSAFFKPSFKPGLDFETQSGSSWFVKH